MKLIAVSPYGIWETKIPDEFDANTCEDYDYSKSAQSIYETDYLIFLAECEVKE